MDMGDRKSMLGNIIFHLIFIRMSYRYRGNVPRTHNIRIVIRIIITKDSME